ASFRSIGGFTVDAQDRLVIADESAGRIRRVESDGTIHTIAGNGGLINDPDGGDALTAQIGFAASIAIDAEGRIAFFSNSDASVHRIESDGTVVTIVGDNHGSFEFVDDCAGRAASLESVNAMVFDSADNLVLVESAVSPPGFAGRVRKWTSSTDHIVTVAGNGTSTGFSSVMEGGSALAASFTLANSVDVDEQDRIFIAAAGDNRILRVDGDGTIHTVVGDGTFDDLGDGGPLSLAHTGGPQSLALRHGNGAFAFVDSPPARLPVVREARNNVVTSVFGQFKPNGAGPFSTGSLSEPSAAVALDDSTLLLAGGLTGVVERARIDGTSATGGTVDLVVGTPDGFSVDDDPLPLSTPAGPEARASFFGLMLDACGIAFDPSSSVAYLADRGGGVIYRLRMANTADPSTWSMSILSGVPGALDHKDGDAASARFIGPCGLAIDADAQQLFVADADDDTIRVVDLADASAGSAITIFGVPGAPGNLDDLLAQPQALALDVSNLAAPALVVADTGNHRVRRIGLVVDASGAVTGATSATNIIGTGEPASSGDGAPATSLPVQSPRGLAFDAAGNLVITSTRTVRLVTPSAGSGVVDGAGAVVTLYGAVPRDAFPADSTFCLSGLQIVSNGVVRVVDGCQGYLVELDRSDLPLPTP
ncbi:MAG TPA: hypothetical protein VGO62_12390, partial [Myxococcota bacterium]